MNWLWVIVGAVAGAFVLHQSGGWLLGAILGAMAERLFRSQRTDQQLEARLRELERKLAEVERGEIKYQQISAKAALPVSSLPVTGEAALDTPSPLTGEGRGEGEIHQSPDDFATLSQPASPQTEVISSAVPKFNDPTWTPAHPAWLERLLSGNLLAKAGVVLLFFGAASGLKMAADYGMFPPAVRLLMAALAGVVLIAFGHNRARQREQHAFGFALQGGGFALLYLSLYFAFSRYGYVSATPAFIGFALLGVGCVLLAMRQDSQVLAGLGLSGAFLAPALASTGGNQYVILFSHFLLLDVFIVAISSQKSWRELNLLGFFFTTLFGFVWALDRYVAAFRTNIEIFLLLFFLLYTLTPALLAHYRKPTGKAWLDGTLLFGVPAVAAVVQGALGYERDYLALTALLAGLYYLGLAWLTRNSENAALSRAFTALALTCLTVAVPLHFGASVTTVFWALEGAAMLAFGLHQQRRLAVAAGVVIQVLAAWRLLDSSVYLDSSMPFWNEFFPGALAIALAGAASAWRLHRPGSDKFAQTLVLTWSLAWWLLAGWNEAATQAAIAHLDALVLLWMTLGALALELLGTRANWTAGRYAAGVLWPVTLLAVLSVTGSQGHPLAGGLLGSLSLALVVSYWMLHRQQRDALLAWLPARHLALFWMLMLAAVIEAGWQAEQLAPATPLWAPVAILAVLCVGLAALRRLQQRNCWPVSGLEAPYQLFAPLPLVAGLVIGLLLLNLNFSGAWLGGAGAMAYLPLLNPLDVISLLSLFSLWQVWHNITCKQHASHAWAALVGGLGLFWLTALWARIAHHYLGVPLSADALEHAAIFQAGVSLLWTATAIAAMLFGSRQHLRVLWFAGVALLAVVGAKLLFLDLGQASLAIRTATLLGMGGLILIAGYFAPAPPKPD